MFKPFRWQEGLLDDEVSVDGKEFLVQYTYEREDYEGDQEFWKLTIIAIDTYNNKVNNWLNDTDELKSDIVSGVEYEIKKLIEESN